MPNFSLTGYRALVTGGSRGIGLGIARGFAEAGANLVLVARDERELAAAKASLAEFPVEVNTAAFDLLATDRIDSFFQGLLQEVGQIDILLNNAGMSRRGPAHEVSLADFQTVLQLNVTAVFALSQAFARGRIAAKQQGTIVNIGSLMCSASRMNTSAYTASKGAIGMLTKSLAIDWAPHGIRVNAIGPGYIDTPLTAVLKSDPQFDAWVKERCPLGRWGSPNDLAGAAVFLASDAASFVTGQILYVDGGWLARF